MLRLEPGKLPTTPPGIVRISWRPSLGTQASPPQGVFNLHVAHRSNSCAPISRDTAEFSSVDLSQGLTKGRDLSFGSPNNVSMRARRRLLSCGSTIGIGHLSNHFSRELRSPRPAGSNIGFAATARSGSCTKTRNCSLIISSKRARLMRSVSGSSELIFFSILKPCSCACGRSRPTHLRRQR